MAHDRSKERCLTPQSAKIAPLSRFWKYFHDRLNWLPIQRPGPLAAIAKGLAHHLDASREDILWLRDQWHPAKCEPEAVPGFGRSRGVLRHSRESDAQFRERVIHAYAWHLLGGKVEGLPQILKFYGLEAPEIINLRRLLPSKWATFQLAFNATQNSRDQAELLANLDVIIWLVNEYKPARSRLFRIYTDEYNMEPGVWSGPLPRCAWSNAWWSHFSGADYPDPNSPDQNILVSLGLAHCCQAEPWLAGAFLAAIWQERRNAFALARRKLAWSAARWSEKFTARRGFFGAMLHAAHAAERILAGLPWEAAPWPDSPWALEEIWDRRLPCWRMFDFGIARSQGVYSDASDKKDNVWSGLNACWSPPYYTLRVGKPPAWSGDKWSGKKEIFRTIRILERFIDKLGAATPPVNPAFGFAFGQSFLALGGKRKPSFTWSKSRWSGKIGKNGFYGESGFATLAGKPVYNGDTWQDFDEWPQRPWAVVERWGREYPRWTTAVTALRGCASQRAHAGFSGFGKQEYDGVFGEIRAVSGPWRDTAWPDLPWGGSAAMPPDRVSGGAIVETLAE